MSLERGNFLPNNGELSEVQKAETPSDSEAIDLALPNLGEPQSVAHKTEFDPVSQLNAAKYYPGEIRKQAMDQYMSRYVEQKEDLARFQADILDYVRSMPDLSHNELYEYSAQQSKELGFSPQQQTIIEWTIAEYQARHIQVEYYRQTYPNDDELFEALFTRPPQGRVEVITRPMNLYIRCFDVNDYAYIHSLKWQSGGEVDKDDIARASKSGGASLSAFNGIILIENCEDDAFNLEAQQALMHEEQHAFARLFSSTTRKMSAYEGMHRAWSNMLEAQSENISHLVKQYFRFIRFDHIDVRAQDELLAYFINDVHGNNLVDILLEPKHKGGLYDYEMMNINDYRETVDEVVHRVGEENRDIVIQSYRTVMKTEYRNLLVSASQSLQDLLSMGYSKSDIVGILLHEPLHMWGRVVSRIGGELTKRIQAN